MTTTAAKKKNLKIQVPALDLQAEYKEIQSELKPRVEKIMKTGRFILGAEVEEFETNFAKFTGTKHAIGLASGSDALLLALMALGIKEGDEVITTPFSFIATATSIARLGAKPVFSDIHPETFNLNPALIKGKITPKTKAILPVHLFGNPCQMDEIINLARKHDLFVIEDCAQATGAEFRVKQVGSFGDFGAFSFYPTKTIGAMGDAGAITTNRLDLYEQLKSLHIHGEASRREPYRHVALGINSRLDEIQAAVLNVKLKRLKKWNELRRKAAERYDEMLSYRTPSEREGLKQNIHLTLPHRTPSASHVYHQYSIRVKKRDELLTHLRSEGIQAGIYYPIPLHLQPCFEYLSHSTGDFPVAERLSREVLALPIYPQIKPDSVNKVCKAIKKFSS